MELLDWVRFFLGAMMLCYGSWMDLKTRRVPNQVWIIFGGLASLLLIYEFTFAVSTYSNYFIFL